MSREFVADRRRPSTASSRRACSGAITGVAAKRPETREDGIGNGYVSFDAVSFGRYRFGEKSHEATESLLRGSKSARKSSSKYAASPGSSIATCHPRFPV